MSETSKVKTDNSKLSFIDTSFLKLEVMMSFFSGIVIFLMVTISTVNILGRWFFNAPVDGYIDWIEQSMAFFVFMGIAFTQREGAHIRMDMFISSFSGRKLWIMELISTLLILFITLILIYGTYSHFLRAYEIGDTSIDIGLPIWPSKLIIPFSLSILAIRLLIQIYAYGRAIKNNEEFPVAVPLTDNTNNIESDTLPKVKN